MSSIYGHISPMGIISANPSCSLCIIQNVLQGAEIWASSLSYSTLHTTTHQYSVLCVLQAITYPIQLLPWVFFFISLPYTYSYVSIHSIASSISSFSLHRIILFFTFTLHSSLLLYYKTIPSSHWLNRYFALQHTTFNNSIFNAHHHHRFYLTKFLSKLLFSQIRSSTAILSTQGTDFTMKERIFVALAWLPKGSLQVN